MLLYRFLAGRGLASPRNKHRNFQKGWRMGAGKKRKAAPLDGGTAVVRVRFSWSGGFHSVNAVYVLEKKQDKWTIIASDKRSYL